MRVLITLPPFELSSRSSADRVASWLAALHRVPACEELFAALTRESELTRALEYFETRIVSGCVVELGRPIEGAPWCAGFFCHPGRSAHSCGQSLPEATLRLARLIQASPSVGPPNPAFNAEPNES